MDVVRYNRLMKLRVRTADQHDKWLVFMWANDPVVRQMSFNQELITPAAHDKWFDKVLASEDTLFYIIEGCYKSTWAPIAQARIESSGEISIAIAAPFRGEKLAVPIIKLLVRQARNTISSPFIAYIKPENIASIKAFENAGFRFAGATEVRGHKCLRYERRVAKRKQKHPPGTDVA